MMDSDQPEVEPGCPSVPQASDVDQQRSGRHGWNRNAMTC